MKKTILIFLIIVVIIISYILIFCTYRGDPPGSLNNCYKEKISVNDVINNARTLKGVFYDQLQGSLGNIGGKLGFLVCCDVPNIAYAKAGLPLENLMRIDYRNHPEHYNSKNGENTPSTIFFFRRVENFYAYCKYNNKLIINCKTPKVGDLIFYGKGHVSLVSEVYKDGTINEIETNRRTIFVVEHVKKKWTNQTVGRLLE